jgi:hypothetical protein
MVAVDVWSYLFDHPRDPTMAIILLGFGALFVGFGVYCIVARVEVARRNQWQMNPEVPLDAEYPGPGEAAAVLPGARWVWMVTLAGAVQVGIGLLILAEAVALLG